MMLFKNKIFYIGSDEEAAHIGCLVPTGFAGHLVVDMLAVDDEVVEKDVTHLALVVIAMNDRCCGR